MAGRARIPIALFLLVASACTIPNLHEARRAAPALPQTSFLYAADGTLITALHAGEDRVIVGSDRMPEVMREAVIAAEDQRFYDHRGIDLRALLRAAYIDATEGRIVEGGSTITQQLVKNLYVGNADTLSRKLKEAVLAWQLEGKLSKEQILRKYLNTVYFGNGAYGIEAAAQTYFGEPASDLTLTQAALLAGVVRAPVDFDPITHPTHARQRRNHVLQLMYDLGSIDLTTLQDALRKPVHLHQNPQDSSHYVAPYFVDYFKQWFLSNPRFGPTPQDRYDRLFSGGLRITTTLVPRLQREAEQAVRSVLPYPSDPYGAMTVLDPRTGAVEAMVGGRDYWNPKSRLAKVNLATGGSTGRQTGSAFKPFPLVTTLEKGASPSSPLNGSSAKIPLENGTYWEPQNAEGSGAGTVSLTTATVDSINVAYANLEVELGDGDAYAGARKIVETPHRKQVVDPSVVSVADDILQKVVQYGTGTAANIGRPQIGKTGTNSDFTDAWFVGAIPQMVTAVWVGFPQGLIPMCCGRVRIGEVFGGTWPAQLWHAFLSAATIHLPVRPFPTPTATSSPSPG